MARYNLEIPKELMEEFSKLEANTDKMLGSMTKAGAETVLQNVKTSIPFDLAKSEIMNCLKITRVYKTPSDDGINTKVGFYGYFKSDNWKKYAKVREKYPKGVPAPLVVNVYEYGTSKFDKQPFFRKSFKKAQIERAMLEVQKEFIKGDK